MSTTFDAALDVKKISPHPANPRRSATADPELVASIKAQGLIQPLIVAPSGDGYVLIAGHRRHDGLKKARLKTAPAVIREDLTTDAQQLEAAVVENVHRVDLTPIEEAEAFEQLRNLKWTQKKIADRTGRPIATVRDRLKLLTLSKKTITSVHTGQLTIGDALAIASFDDKTQARLSKAAGTPHFQHALQQEKSKRSNQRKFDAVIEQLGDVPVIELGKGQYWYSHPSLGLERLSPDSPPEDVQALVAQLRVNHPDCLGYFTETPESYFSGRVHLRCTNPETHAEEEPDFADVDDEADRRRLEVQKAREEEVQALAAARAVRVNTIMGQVGAGTKLDARFVDVTRVLLPQLLAQFSQNEAAIYQPAAGIPEPDRWDFGWQFTDNTAASQVAKFTAHVDAIAKAPAATLARLLLAALLALVEHGTVGYPRSYNRPLAPAFAARYYQLLQALGFEPSAVDVANIELTVAVDEVTEDDEVAS